MAASTAWMRTCAAFSRALVRAVSTEGKVPAERKAPAEGKRTSGTEDNARDHPDPDRRRSSRAGVPGVRRPGPAMPVVRPRGLLGAIRERPYRRKAGRLP